MEAAAAATFLQAVVVQCHVGVGPPDGAVSCPVCQKSSGYGERRRKQSRRKDSRERTNERARGTCHQQQVLHESCSAWYKIFEMLKQTKYVIMLEGETIFQAEPNHFDMGKELHDNYIRSRFLFFSYLIRIMK